MNGLTRRQLIMNKRIMIITCLVLLAPIYQAAATEKPSSKQKKYVSVTILFDTGTKSKLLFENIEKLKINPNDVEIVVISHNHGDHTGGLLAFLGKNSNVLVYLPPSCSGSFVQEVKRTGAKVVTTDAPVEICKGVHLTGPMGTQIISEFRKLGVKKAGPTHCTGDRAIQMFKQAYGPDFVQMGVGRRLKIEAISENVCEKTSCRGMGILPMCRKSFIVFKPSFSHGRDASETHGQDARATFHTRSKRFLCDGIDGNENGLQMVQIWAKRPKIPERHYEYPKSF